jgi:hypothetical protein
MMFRSQQAWAIACLCCLGAGCGGETTGANSTATSGTGGSPDTTSCVISQTINSGGTSVTQSFCLEATGLTPDQINAQKTACTTTTALDGGLTQTASFSDGACSRANVLGGCRITSGGFTQTMWYYANSVLSVEQLQMLCSNLGGTYLSAAAAGP